MCGLRRLHKDSLPCPSLKLSGFDLNFSLTWSISELHRHGCARHIQSYKNEVGYFVQASMREISCRQHERRITEHLSQLGGSYCVKSNNIRKLKHLGVPRVGSVLRNLEQEDDTDRETNFTHSLPCEDSRISKASGEAVAYDQPSKVSPVVTNSNPLPNPHVNEHDVEHQGAKNGSDKKGEDLVVQDSSMRENKQRLGSLLDA